MAGIKHVTVNRYNYIAQLPEDFVNILSVYRSGELYVQCLTDLRDRYKMETPPNNDEYFYIIGSSPATCIAFRGKYSRWWIIRKFQQLADLYWPVKYKITYYSK